MRYPWQVEPPAVSEYDEMLARILMDIYFFGSIISAILLIITLFIFSYFRWDMLAPSSRLDPLMHSSTNSSMDNLGMISLAAQFISFVLTSLHVM